MTTSSAPHVAVIGAGWAGCAAAVVLAKRGVRVSLMERARALGGRARGVALDGLTLDNGQHLLIGAFHRTLRLIERVHPAGRAPPLFRRLPLPLQPFGAEARGAVTLRARALPAPLNLAAGISAARGLSLPDRLALIRDFQRLARAGFRTPSGQTVAQFFAGTPLRALASVW